MRQRDMPMKNALPLRGHGLFVFLYSVLTTVRKKGALASMTEYGTGFALVALAYSWKARQVMHWRLSRRVSKQQYDERDAICRVCPRVKVVDDRRYKSRESRYCGSCGCKDWAWSELTVKNRRRGHYCPLGSHPGSEKPKPKGGCGGCGSKGNLKTSPNNGRMSKFTEWYVRSGLQEGPPRMRPQQIGVLNDG